MPAAFNHPCRKPGCRELTLERYCAEHRQYGDRQIAERRGTTKERGYAGAWPKLRAMKMAADPLCEACGRRGLVVAGAQVDHIVPHKMNGDLMYDMDNLQALCTECHGLKSACESRGQDPRVTYPERRLIP